MLTRQEEAGDFDFACLREYGPTWRIGGPLGVRVTSVAVFRETEFGVLQGDQIMTADPKVSTRQVYTPLDVN